MYIDFEVSSFLRKVFGTKFACNLIFNFIFQNRFEAGLNAASHVLAQSLRFKMLGIN